MSSSNANMMSLPSWCWIPIDTSGLEAMLRPIDMAGEDHAVVAHDCVRGLDGLHLNGGVGWVCLPGELLGQHLLEACASDNTWKPPESVYVGPTSS